MAVFPSPLPRRPALRSVSRTGCRRRAAGAIAPVQSGPSNRWTALSECDQQVRSDGRFTRFARFPPAPSCPPIAFLATRCAKPSPASRTIPGIDLADRGRRTIAPVQSCCAAAARERRPAGVWLTKQNGTEPDCTGAIAAAWPSALAHHLGSKTMRVTLGPSAWRLLDTGASHRP